MPVLTVTATKAPASVGRGGGVVVVGKDVAVIREIVR